MSDATRNAMLHVVAHEIGHAVLREFDLPILGPEEGIADDFATLYIYSLLPDRAEAIIRAHARQSMSDGQDAMMFGEHPSDDQRAGRAICILYGQNPDQFAKLASDFGLDGEEADACRDFAPEIARSWRRTLAPYLMPDSARVTEVGLRVAEDPVLQALATQAFVNDLYKLMASIDWHSRITLELDQCNGTASWARNGRRIRICSAYVQRFEAQLGSE
ncbi:MAG: hypothetical protein HRU30_19145 [Rhodobacteraceae bacterium]|nr:hypothetical protein [Paracoccaceae bacterium]